MIAKPLVAHFVGYDISIWYADGGHGLVLHTAGEVGIAYPILLVPEGIPAKDGGEVINDLADAVEIGLISRIKSSCVHEEILDEHGVSAAGKMPVRSVLGIAGHGDGNEIVVDGIVGLPMKCGIAGSR